MARRRMLDPEFFFDEELARTENSAYVRLFYEGLWCHCDDNFHTIPKKLGWLKAQILPYEDIDVLPLWEELVRIGKLKEFCDETGEVYAWLKNFGKHQRIEKPSKSKFPEYPGVVGEESGSTPAKVKLSKVKESKEEGDKPPSIPIFERKIREKEQDYRDLVKDLASVDYLSEREIHNIALTEFLPYWLEQGEGARKARWEKEKAFDYSRRFRTWVKTYHEKFQKDVKCFSAGIWHRKGESCHHEKPEIDYKSLPTSKFARDLGEAKRIST